MTSLKKTLSHRRKIQTMFLVYIQIETPVCSRYVCYHNGRITDAISLVIVLNIMTVSELSQLEGAI